MLNYQKLSIVRKILVICILFISFFGCEESSDEKLSDDNEIKEAIQRSVVYGEHKIETILTGKMEVLINVDNDSENDINISYLEYTEFLLIMEPVIYFKRIAFRTTWCLPASITNRYMPVAASLPSQ